jgi:hypothetical protein
MWVRSLCKHYNGTYRHEGAEWEHSGPLYEHIVPAKKPTADESQKDEPTSRSMKPAKA